MTKFMKSIFVSTALVMSAGCSVAQDKPVKAQKPSAQAVKTTPGSHGHSTYRKPSAAIYFNHDFSGSAEIGMMQAINLNVTDQYPGATISLKFTPSEGIRYFGPAQLTHRSTAIEGLTSTTSEIGEGGGNAIPLQFQPLTEGVHKLSVIATASLADGQSIVRSYMIPIYVGDAYQPTKQSFKDQAVKPSKPPVSSGGFIIMDAEETIED